MILPKLFEDRMRELLGDEYGDYEKCFDDPHLGGLRVNTMKISPEEFEKICPFPIKRIPWVKNGYFYDINEHPARHPFYYGGLYYIQEPSAMTPASLLPIEEGDKVLDLCAAPGGKSTELGARLNGTGLLVSNDISNSRAKALLKNIELFGIQNSVVVSETPDKLLTYFPEYFDKILIDAPCSGEGMFRKNAAMIKDWEEYGVSYYSEIQKDIIATAAKMLKPGGYILYSTCTFSPEENEGTIARLLELYPEFTVVNPYPSEEVQIENSLSYEGFGCGKPEWIPNGVEEMKHCIRLWPHKIKGEGHFIALLYKRPVEAIDGIEEKKEKQSWLKEVQELTAATEDSSDKEDRSHRAAKNKKNARNQRSYSGKNNSNAINVRKQNHLSDEAIEFIQSIKITGLKGFHKDDESKEDGNQKVDHKVDNTANYKADYKTENSCSEVDLKDIVVRDDKVYYMPKELPDLKGLRILRHGLLLGEMKKERFEPSQALANALSIDGYKKLILLSHDDSNVIRFLKCESIDLEGSYEDGWNLVCVDNHPLGWCKINKQNMKNKYAPGWRWV